MKDVYINKTAAFLPNSPVDNEMMEEKLGYIDGKTSKARRIVLRNNKIETRYYAIDSEGNITHNNAQLTKEAIYKLLGDTVPIDTVELLSCGTGSPDQILPSHAAMVHGELKAGDLEVNSPTGACCSGMNALKYGYLAVKSGQVNTAVCTGSERISSWMQADVFEEEIEYLKELEEQPLLSFHKEFLRWMLSDGAGAFLLQSEPKGDIPIRMEWMEAYSYAHELEACMYAGGEKQEDGSLKLWSEYPADMWSKMSLFAIKQDTRLLGQNILIKGVNSLKRAMDKHGITADEVDYYLPHISSYYFHQSLYMEMKKQGVEIGWDKWFMNLKRVGNIGSASIFIMLDELVRSGSLQSGDRILLSVPESARFSYAYAYLTVV